MADYKAPDNEKPGWADTKAFRNGLLAVLVIAAVVSVIAGFIPAFQKRALHFAVEGFGAFFAVYGFFAFMVIVLVGQHLRKLVGRKESYYDERE
jgi:hypothetical protein